MQRNWVNTSTLSQEEKILEQDTNQMEWSVKIFIHVIPLGEASVRKDLTGLKRAILGSHVYRVVAIWAGMVQIKFLVG